eukprot:scaffold2284_cov402-Prasinococcus_capsulatus_cf.AAC.19
MHGQDLPRRPSLNVTAAHRPGFNPVPPAAAAALTSTDAERCGAGNQTRIFENTHTLCVEELPARALFCWLPGVQGTNLYGYKTSCERTQLKLSRPPHKWIQGVACWWQRTGYSTLVLAPLHHTRRHYEGNQRDGNVII